MFTEHFLINLKNKTYIETYEEHNNVDDNSKGFDRASIKQNEYFIKKAPVEYELFRSISASQSIKISNTQLFTNRNCGNNDFSYLKLSNNKIFFGFSRLCDYDTADEAWFIANNDGSYQQNIYNGFANGEFEWRENSQGIIFWEGEGDVLGYFGQKNEKKTLIKGNVTALEFINL